MNRFLLGLILGATAVLAPAISKPAQAQSAAYKAQGRQAIVEAYTKIDKAILTRDPKIFVEKLAPDFEGYADNGQKFGRTQALMRVYDTMNSDRLGSPLKITKTKTKLTSFTWRNSDVITMAQTTQVGNLRQDGKDNRVEIVVLSRDYWRRYKTGWLARQSVVRQSTIWLNGKKIRSIK